MKLNWAFVCGGAADDDQAAAQRGGAACGSQLFKKNDRQLGIAALGLDGGSHACSARSYDDNVEFLIFQFGFGVVQHS